jgi:serine/threonine protein kinase/N-acetylneuraminic acid mutarotase
MRLKANQKVGPWILLSLLGKGGNGEVWESKHDDGSVAAVKCIKSQKPTSEPYQRFVNEVKIQQQLTAVPGLLPLIGAYLPHKPSDADPAWLAMPIAQGIKSFLGDSPKLEEVIEVIAGIAETLALLAEKGISHRDIKPGNLYVYQGRASIGDFGLVDFPDKEALTEPGKTIGPRNFLAPEMLSYSETVDGRLADVYSLAKTLWVLATGQTFPPPGEQRLDTPQMLLRTWVLHPRAFRLDPLIERATKHDPQSRPMMTEFRDELRAWLNPGTTQTESMDLSAITKRIADAVSSTKQSVERRSQQIALAQAAVRKLEEGLALVNRQLDQAKPDNGSIGLNIVFDTTGVGIRCESQSIWREGRCIVLSAPDKQAPFLWSGVGAVLYDNDELCLVAAHILVMQGNYSQSQLLWWDAKWVHLGSSLEDRAISELKSGLLNNLSNALSLYAEAAEQIHVQGRVNLTSISRSVWQPASDIRMPRSYFGAASLGDEIFIAGGINERGEELASVEKYNPKTDQWEECASLSSPRTGLALAACNQKLYAVGGFRTANGGYLNTVEEYDPIRGTWDERASMPTARQFFALVAGGDGNLYAIGGTSHPGNGASIIHSEIEKYSPFTDEWQAMATMPTKRYNLGAVATTDGKIYVAGGREIEGCSYAQLEEYDLVKNTWTKRANMYVARNDHGIALASNGKVYVLGGGSFSQVVEVYSPKENSWKPWHSLSFGRTATKAVTVGNKVYILGGQIPSGLCRTVEWTMLDNGNC